MKPNRSLSFLFLLLVPVLVLSHSVLFAAQQITPKRVLVLASYRATSPVAYQWDRGIRSVFKAGPSDRIAIDIEYLHRLSLTSGTGVFDRFLKRDHPIELQ